MPERLGFTIISAHQKASSPKPSAASTSSAISRKASVWLTPWRIWLGEDPEVYVLPS